MKRYPLELDGARPLCFTPLEWQDWTRAERADANADDYVSDPNGFCGSCTEAHQAMMKAAGKCRHPEVTFVDGVGIRNRPA